MSNRFTQQAVAAFLLEQGCPELRANFISNFVITALRSVSMHAKIADQTVNEDFTAYHVEVAAIGGNGFTVDYSVTRLGPGFNDHRAKVTSPDVEYTVTRLVHEPQDAVAPAPLPPVEEMPVQAAAPVEVEAEAVTVEAEAVTVEADVVVEAATIEEAAPEVVEAPVVEEAPEVVEAPVVEEAPVAAEAEAEKPKKAKGKKKAD